MDLSAQSNEIIAQNSTYAKHAGWETVLKQNVQKANELWGLDQSDLKLATEILEMATAHEANQYFRLGSHFYLWSLRNSSGNDYSTLKSEAQKIMPLLSEDDQKKWEQYIENDHGSLADELYGFWIKNDPYVTTKINERLIEHWSRIAYARKHFTKNDNTPYGTDDRGTIYVRLGPPDRKLEKKISVSQVADPLGFGLYTFQAGNELDGEIMLWEYFNIDTENYFFIFGNRDGNGDFGLQKSILDAFEFNDIRLQTNASLAMTNSVWRNFSISLAKYALFEKMAAYHTHFEDIYLETVSRLLENPKQDPSLASTMSRFNLGLKSIESLDYFETSSQLAKVPEVSTKLTSGKEQGGFENLQKFYRFLNDDGEQEQVLAINSKIDSTYYKSLNDLLVNHSVFLYDENWNLLNKLGSTQKSTPKKSSYTSVYSLNEVIREAQMFHASELIATISSTAPLILSATGKKPLEVPEPLTGTSGFLVSDIMIGESQEIDTKQRIPIIPSLDFSFSKGSNIMIFFEAYNIPEGGYSFTYHFEKNRWLFGNKRVDNKPAVTILADKAKGSDNQLFSVELTNLEMGAYDLVIEYKLLNETSEASTFEKRIPFEITE